MSIATPKTQTLIDTISTGYRALNRRIWVIGVPIGISAYLWFGRPVLFGDLNGAASFGQTLPNLAGLSAIQQEVLNSLLASDVRLVFAWLNFVPVFAAPVPTAVESALRLNSALDFFLALLLVNLCALLLSSLFLTLVGGAVQHTPVQPLAELRQALRVAGTLFRVLLVLLGVGLLLGLPFLALSTILIAVLPVAAVPVFLTWYIAIFWAYIYVGFAPEAILLSRNGPLRAIYNSVNLVRRNLAATLGLLLVSIVITSGLALVWRQLATNPPGLMVAFIGSAYVGSGLSAARMEFYRERMARWKRAV